MNTTNTPLGAPQAGPTGANPVAVAGRRYIVQLTIAMLAYVAICFAVIYAVNHTGVAGWLKVALLLLPVIPVVAVFLAVLQFLGATDEFDRKVMLESLAVAAGITALLAITYTFLENAGLPRPEAWWTWVVLVGSWGVAKPIVSRYYQ
jgi:hypothetical protein